MKQNEASLDTPLSYQICMVNNDNNDYFSSSCYPLGEMGKVQATNRELFSLDGFAWECYMAVALTCVYYNKHQLHPIVII